MPSKSSSTYTNPFLFLWQKLANDSAIVIGLRLLALPWQMILTPELARRELDLMVSEKRSGCFETV